VGALLLVWIWLKPGSDGNVRVCGVVCLGRWRRGLGFVDLEERGETCWVC
jgi:hypothetical protein